jgi:bis(5'-nucleosidyl)-tetraphosphatase
MKHVTIAAFGVIPVLTKAPEFTVLLVEQYSAEGTHWGFPKGKAEPHEAPTETALREMREEVGITPRLISEPAFTISYTFTYQDTIVHKTVTYFFGLVDQPGFALRESEIKDADWFSLEAARAKLTFENTRAVLDAAASYATDHPLHA